jgi:hypothetical protein
MALAEHSVTVLSYSAPAATRPGRRRHASFVGALALVLGWAICAPAVLAQSSPDLSGKWHLTCAGGRKGKTRHIALNIEQQGSTLTGSYSGGRRSGQLNGSVQGNRVSFQLAGERGTASFTGTIDGNTLQVHMARGFSCSATRR